jgi:hypothetical protein
MAAALPHPSPIVMRDGLHLASIGNLTKETASKVEAFITELREKAENNFIDWYAMACIAAIKVIGDIEVAKQAIREILPNHPDIKLFFVR